MGLLQNDRIDLVKTKFHMPVPPEILEATEKRIHREIKILKAHGKDPNKVVCIVADKILQKASRMPQNGKRGI